MRQDARENRERILAAAEHVFGSRGETGSTEEVARLAGVGIATVFRHFPTKEALVEAALVRHFIGLLDSARAAATAPDPSAALSTLIHEMIERGASKLTLASMLDRAQVGGGHGAAPRAGRRQRPAGCRCRGALPANPRPGPDHRGDAGCGSRARSRRRGHPGRLRHPMIFDWS
jgi:AcrR family transcriptional regulator